LEQEDEARSSYERAVGRHLTGMNFLAAAALCEQKLADPEKALAYLLGGWPQSTQARSCLQESFRLLARHSKHDQARKQIERLPESADTQEAINTLASVLGDVATTYPDAGVQYLAADRTRVLVGSQLASAGEKETAYLTDIIRRLVPQDRLLSRDCHRFAANRRKKVQPPPAARKKAPGVVELVHEFNLSRQPCDWRAAVASGDVFFAAGYRRSVFYLVRGLWNGMVDSSLRDVGSIEDIRHRRVQLACDPNPGAREVFIVSRLDLSRYSLEFSAFDRFPNPSYARTFSGSGPQTWAIQCSQGLVYCLDYDPARDGHDVKTFTIAGELLETRGLPRLPVDEESIKNSYAFVVRQEMVLFSHGATLQVRDREGDANCTFASEVCSLAASLPHTRMRFAVGLEQGGFLYWGNPAQTRGIPFGEDLHRPKLGFSRGGHLVAASQEEIQVYGTRGGTLKYLEKGDGCGAEPIAVLAPMQSDRFVVAFRDGRMRVYSVHAS
jgi:hypothetical protein